MRLLLLLRVSLWLSGLFMSVLWLSGLFMSVCAGLLLSSAGDFPMSISTFLSIKSDKKILALKYRPLEGPPNRRRKR